MPTRQQDTPDRFTAGPRNALVADRRDGQVRATLIASDQGDQISIPVSISMSRPAADRLRAFMSHGQNRFVVSSSDGALSVRISMVIARSSATEEVVAHLANAAIDWDRGTIGREGRTAALSRTELRLLACLVEHAGETVPHDVLISSAWGAAPDDAGYNALAVYVCYLRRSLKSIGLGQALRTARGVGYSLGDPSRPVAETVTKPRSAARDRPADSKHRHSGESTLA